MWKELTFSWVLGTMIIGRMYNIQKGIKKNKGTLFIRGLCLEANQNYFKNVLRTKKNGVILLQDTKLCGNGEGVPKGLRCNDIGRW